MYIYIYTYIRYRSWSIFHKGQQVHERPGLHRGRRIQDRELRMQARAIQGLGRGGGAAGGRGAAPAAVHMFFSIENHRTSIGKPSKIIGKPSKIIGKPSKIIGKHVEWLLCPFAHVFNQSDRGIGFRQKSAGKNESLLGKTDHPTGNSPIYLESPSLLGLAFRCKATLNGRSRSREVQKICRRSKVTGWVEVKLSGFEMFWVSQYCQTQVCWYMLIPFSMT